MELPVTENRVKTQLPETLVHPILYRLSVILRDAVLHWPGIQ